MELYNIFSYLLTNNNILFIINKYNKQYNF